MAEYDEALITKGGLPLCKRKRRKEKEERPKQFKVCVCACVCMVTCSKLDFGPIRGFGKNQGVVQESE